MKTALKYRIRKWTFICVATEMRPGNKRFGTKRPLPVQITHAAPDPEERGRLHCLISPYRDAQLSFCLLPILSGEAW